jgi:hypothetical protein
MFWSILYTANDISIASARTPERKKKNVTFKQEFQFVLECRFHFLNPPNIFLSRWRDRFSRQNLPVFKFFLWFRRNCVCIKPVSSDCRERLQACFGGVIRRNCLAQQTPLGVVIHGCAFDSWIISLRDACHVGVTCLTCVFLIHQLNTVLKFPI